MKSNTVPAGEFKAKCLKMIDDVAENGKPIIVTKRGKPVVKVMPISSQSDFVGSMRGTVLQEGDIISPIDAEWEAMK